jgi:phage FluMu protein Com
MPEYFNCEGCGKLVHIREIPQGMIEVLCGECRNKVDFSSEEDKEDTDEADVDG